MKRIIITLAILLLLTVPAHSALDLLGQGTSAHGTYNLIYDTDLDITWYDVSYSSTGWDNAVAWTDSLSVTFGSNTYIDWRLPLTVDGPSIFSYDGTTAAGYNITSSEMGHLFYMGLGNAGEYDTSGNPNPTACGAWDQPDCLTNTGDFQNLQASAYWSGTEYSAGPSYAWNFHTNSGGQYVRNKDDGIYAVAVMTGMAVVPEPISSILFLTGGGVLAGRKFFGRKT